MLGSIGLAPALSPAIPALAGSGMAATTAAPTAVPAISATTYKWAEMLVRAHDKCNISMLERLLQLDNASATALRDQLLKNGVISSSRTAYGMHKAVKPLYTEIMPRKSLSESLHRELYGRNDTLEVSREVTSQESAEASDMDVQTPDEKIPMENHLDKQPRANPETGDKTENNTVVEPVESELELAESTPQETGLSRLIN